MNKTYSGNVKANVETARLEKIYEDFVLPEFGITGQPAWSRHIKTNPDNFLHLFTVGEVGYALAYDDFPSEFSIRGDDSVRTIKLPDGDKILTVDSYKAAYIENITGSFVLFQILDQTAFEIRLNYVEAAYRQQKRKWQAESKQTVIVARNILQLAESAAKSHDVNTLYSLEGIVEALLHLDAEDSDVDLKTLRQYLKVLNDAEFGYEIFDEEDRERLAREVYGPLSTELQDIMNIRKYEVKNLGSTLRLVSAMYAKTEHESTEGMSVAVLCTEDGRRYPLDHFANEELESCFEKNAFIVKENIQFNMPEELCGYRLVEGSVLVRDVFERELEEISF